MKNVKRILASFDGLNGTKFIGIHKYESKTTGELANHVVNAGFKYENAVKKDLASLKALTENDVIIISNDINIDKSIVSDAISALITSFENNQNAETKSNQSKGQENAFVHITNGVKFHIESQKLHIYAMAISKEIIKAGEYKTVNSRPLTITKNAVKKYCNFSTAKYRNFIVDDTMLKAVKMSGETLSLV